MKNDLLIQGLYENTLVNPMFRDNKLDRLLIISGYASSAMGFHHLNDLKGKGKLPEIDLVYGMAKTDGVSPSSHRGFLSLSEKDFPGKFSCSYLRTGEPVHAKVYIWCRGETPIKAFTGSANYTQQALVKSLRREVMAECNAKRAYDYFKAIRGDAILCSDKKVPTTFRISFRQRPNGESEITRIPFLSNEPPMRESEHSVAIVEDRESPFYGHKKAAVFLTDRSGKVPARSGLNWGQRPEYGRDPNQAYLSVRGDLRKDKFFPPRGIHFTVLTDDGKIIQCVRAQGDEGAEKGIETPHDNAELGKYFRERLGLASGAPVTLEDLEKYGRKDVVFYKDDDENFYLDFSKPK